MFSAILKEIFTTAQLASFSMPTVRNVLLHLEVKITIPLNAKRPSFSAAQI